MEFKLNRSLEILKATPRVLEHLVGGLSSEWTVHDFDHINQISRVLAKQYKDAVGPWFAYLGILKRPI